MDIDTEQMDTDTGDNDGTSGLDTVDRNHGAKSCLEETDHLSTNRHTFDLLDRDHLAPRETLEPQRGHWAPPHFKIRINDVPDVVEITPYSETYEKPLRKFAFDKVEWLF